MPIRVEEFDASLPAVNASAWRAKLAGGDTLAGLWASATSPITTEILGRSGADWVVIDAEHSLNDLRSIAPQLSALDATPVFTVVRASSRDPLELGRLLDAGARGIMVPRVDTAEDAVAAVAATRYPPAGIRGVGGGFARATRWRAISDYLPRAEETFFLIVQVESVQGLQALPDILAVDGIDAVFFGPADLAASMGLLGQPRHPDVQAAVEKAIGEVTAAGSIAGMQAFDLDDALRFQRAGARILAIEADVTLLSNAASAHIDRFRAHSPQRSGEEK